MLNVLSDLSNSFGDEDGEYKDLLTMDSDEPVPVDGGAEFLQNSGLSLFLDFGLGERSGFNDFLFGLGVRLNILLILALKLNLIKNVVLGWTQCSLIRILNQSVYAYLEAELHEAFSVSLLDRLASGSWFGQEEERLGFRDIFGLGGGVGGMLTSLAGGRGTAVSFNFTITLSKLPSLFERVSLLKRLLNWDTDNEFVIVLDETDDIREETDDAIEEVTVFREGSDGNLNGTDVAAAFMSIDVESFFSNQMLFCKSAIEGRRTGSFTFSVWELLWSFLSCELEVLSCLASLL